MSCIINCNITKEVKIIKSVMIVSLRCCFAATFQDRKHPDIRRMVYLRLESGMLLPDFFFEIALVLYRKKIAVKTYFQW